VPRADCGIAAASASTQRKVNLSHIVAILQLGGLHPPLRTRRRV